MAVSISELEKTSLAKRIAGEIVLAESPGSAIKKWRSFLKIGQKELCEKLGTSPSVLSDYEGGRRKSPGTVVIRRIVNAMLDIESRRGGDILRQFVPDACASSAISAIIDMREFAEPVEISKFCKAINAVFLNKGDVKKQILGYTVIDSLEAIVNLPPTELVKIYGSTTERALIFTKVSTGKSPMVAIKVTDMKPALVVLQGTENVDDIAIKIAEAENISLALSKISDVKELTKKISKRFG